MVEKKKDPNWHAHLFSGMNSPAKLGKGPRHQTEGVRKKAEKKVRKKPSFISNKMKGDIY